MKSFHQMLLSKRFLFTDFYLCLTLVCTALVHAAASDISGQWELQVQTLNDTSYARVEFKAEGEKLTGRLNELMLSGSMAGNGLTFTGKRPTGSQYGEFTGRTEGDTLQGTVARPDGTKGTWSAKRAAQPPSSPRTHRFAPTEFHRVFSDAPKPVLHLFPGDTVQTWTVDAGGIDSAGVHLSAGGNPQTGPFYIEGAFPGDMVAITIKKLRLNRDSAEGGNRIVPTAVTASYLERNKFQEAFDATWVLDRDKGTGQLKHPSKHLTNYVVKLQPMLGCVAVAPPAHQAFRTGYLGSYGGNLDYNQIREGTTVYLPVYVPGALVFVGDGHALQGDGELTGDALETSMEIEFTVNLVRNQWIGNPRAENESYRMTFGVANSMPEALQAATAEMANWLQRDYKLDPNEAAIVLGTAMEYNIAEVVDPQVHIVAKVRKDALAGLK